MGSERNVLIVKGLVNVHATSHVRYHTSLSALKSELSAGLWLLEKFFSKTKHRLYLKC